MELLFLMYLGLNGINLKSQQSQRPASSWGWIDLDWPSSHTKTNGAHAISFSDPTQKKWNTSCNGIAHIAPWLDRAIRLGKLVSLNVCWNCCAWPQISGSIILQTVHLIVCLKWTWIYLIGYKKDYFVWECIYVCILELTFSFVESIDDLDPHVIPVLVLILLELIDGLDWRYIIACKEKKIWSNQGVQKRLNVLKKKKRLSLISWSWKLWMVTMVVN